MRPTGLPESVPESVAEPGVSKEPELLPVILCVATAPAAPAAVLPAADSCKGSDVLVEKAVPSDEGNKLALAVSVARMLVISVVLEYETLIVGVAVVNVESETPGELLLPEDSGDVESAVGFAV